MKRESLLYFIMVLARTSIPWKESSSTHWKAIPCFGLRTQMKLMSTFFLSVLLWSLSTSFTQLFVTKLCWSEPLVIMSIPYPTNMLIGIEAMELTISCFLVMIGYLFSIKLFIFYWWNKLEDRKREHVILIHGWHVLINSLIKYLSTT